MFFFLKYTAPTEISTLPLPDALPISEVGQKAMPLSALLGTSTPCMGRRACGGVEGRRVVPRRGARPPPAACRGPPPQDRKSTRLNSSHANISYAVFCLKKKKHVKHHL